MTGKSNEAEEQSRLAQAKALERQSQKHSRGAVMD
jgi:hypothetical protein